MRLHTGHKVPEQIERTVRGWQRGDQPITPGWLESLPSAFSDLSEKWDIHINHIVPDTWVTLVALGDSAQLGPVVLKTSALADEFLSESTALQLGAGTNVARIYDLDAERSTLVLERIVPGTQLRDAKLSDDDATRLAAETIVGFWRDVPVTQHLHPLRKWMRALFNWSPRPDLIDQSLIEQAQALAENLLASSSRTCLLHGDFQHHNLLMRESGERVIIDPKGLYGDPGFEFAAWMYNPEGVTARPDYIQLANRRADICSEIWGIDRQRLLEWAFVGAVLSMCWWNTESGPEDLADHFARGAHGLRTLLR